jgi:hypothetical protein
MVEKGMAEGGMRRQDTRRITWYANAAGMVARIAITITLRVIGMADAMRTGDMKRMAVAVKPAMVIMAAEATVGVAELGIVILVAVRMEAGAAKQDTVGGAHTKSAECIL